MLKDKMYWLKASDNLRTEVRQSSDEGRDIGDLISGADAVLAMPDSAQKEALAEKLMLEMENRPLRNDYPYVEPETYADIRAVLPESRKLLCPLSEEELSDKLAGAWTGRACGCLLGIPVEGWYRQKIRDFLEASGQFPLRSYMSSDVDEKIRKEFGITDRDSGFAYDRQMKCWINNMTEYPVDDDMNYTMLSLRVLETCGKHFTSEDVAQAWLFAIPAMHTCTAERVAYRNLLQCRMPPVSGTYMNPFREWIGAQIRVDFYGYINPGDPEAAAGMAYRDAVVAQSRNGVYAAMFIAALISLMPTGAGYRVAAEEALKQVPPGSRLAAEINRIMAQFDEGMSCSDMLDDIHRVYNEKDPYDWCLAIPNVLIILTVLLHCRDDYSRAICLAVTAGFDTDCNAATVGSAIGYHIGLSKIDDRWTAPLRPVFHSSVYRYEQCPIPELAERTLRIIRTE